MIRRAMEWVGMYGKEEHIISKEENIIMFMLKNSIKY